MRNRASYNNFELLKLVGIFQVGIFLGEFTRREFDGWDFLGGSFPGEIFLEVRNSEVDVS